MNECIRSLEWRKRKTKRQKKKWRNMKKYQDIDTWKIKEEGEKRQRGDERLKVIAVELESSFLNKAIGCA